MAQQATATPQPLSPGILVNPTLTQRLFQTRRTSTELTALLSAEDMTVQAMEDASPTKWHLAHVTWFFETFLLKTYLPGYRVFDPTLQLLLQFLLRDARPAAAAPQARSADAAVGRARAWPIARMSTRRSTALLAQRRRRARGGRAPRRARHQSRAAASGAAADRHPRALRRQSAAAGLSRAAGRDRSPRRRRRDRLGRLRGRHPRCRPRRRRLLLGQRGPRHERPGASLPSRRPSRHQRANGSSSCADGGYRTASLWLADGWTRSTARSGRRRATGRRATAAGMQMTLQGLQPVEPAAPVRHVSYYEADAFARWAGKRLPTEFEWEVAAAGAPVDRQHARQPRAAPAARAACRRRRAAPDVRRRVGVDGERLPPLPRLSAARPARSASTTASSWSASTCCAAASCATPDGHSRATYRNFFYPHQRWQFIGLRLASEID